MKQRTKDNAEAWRKWISGIVILFIPVIQGYYANRNDDNAKDRADKLRAEQWQQRRLVQDSVNTKINFLYLREMNEAKEDSIKALKKK